MTDRNTTLELCEKLLAVRDNFPLTSEHNKLFTDISNYMRGLDFDIESLETTGAKVGKVSKEESKLLKTITKQKKELQALKNEVEALGWSIHYSRQKIKTAWWVLTDIKTQDLSPEIYLNVVAQSLQDIAYEVMDEDESK